MTPSPGPDDRGVEKYRRLSPLNAERAMAMYHHRDTAAAAVHCQCSRMNIVRAVQIAERTLRVQLFVRAQNSQWILLPDRERIWHRINMMVGREEA